MAILTVKTKIELTHNASFEFNICIGLITILCTLYFLDSRFIFINLAFNICRLLDYKRIHRIRIYTIHLISITKCNRSFMKMIPV